MFGADRDDQGIAVDSSGGEKAVVDFAFDESEIGAALEHGIRATCSVFEIESVSSIPG